jgi:two-component system, OmpR family, phosphate regulon response regulator PhoB
LLRRSCSKGGIGRVVVGPEVVRPPSHEPALRRWPCALAEHQGSVRPAERGAASGSSTIGRRVLVVDDEPSVRMLCRFNLLAAGMDVREAVDGREALALIEEEAPDLVLLDVMMPAIDGWEVARELQRDPRTRDLPIVFLTARVERADRQRAADLGAVGYLSKPFDPIALPAMLERIMEQVARGERVALRRLVMEAGGG